MDFTNPRCSSAMVKSRVTASPVTLTSIAEPSESDRAAKLAL